MGNFAHHKGNHRQWGPPLTSLMVSQMEVQMTLILAVLGVVRRWAKSPTNRFAAGVGLLVYFSYAWGHDAWAKPGVIAAALVIGLCLPKYSRISNKLDEKLCLLTASVTAGRLGRFLLQYAFNFIVLGMMAKTGAVQEAALAQAGGFAGLAALTTAASQGAQYVALLLSRHGMGEPTANVQFGLAANVAATAVSTFGYPGVAQAYTALALALGATLFAWGVLSDLRGWFAPTGGIGVYFGTFNPFHRTHLQLVRRALDERGLSKVIIHPTLLTQFHRQAFEKGEIRVGRIENGFEVYEKTDRADPNVDYFPTGDRFLPPAIRRNMIEAAIREAGLEGRVEVWFLPEVYAKRGFHRRVPRRAPRQSGPAHACHPRQRLGRHAGARHLRRQRLALSLRRAPPRQGLCHRHPPRRPRPGPRRGRGHARATPFHARPAGRSRPWVRPRSTNPSPRSATTSRQSLKSARCAASTT
jgi:hypothetical protein